MAEAAGYNGYPDPEEKSMRYLALDIGQKTIGLAVSDPLGVVARPLMVLPLGKTADALERLRQLLAELEVETLVVGYPVFYSGDRGAAVERVERWVRRLKKISGLPVVAVDERYTTREAREHLAASPKSARRSREKDDALAAAFILKRLLDEGQDAIREKW